MERKIKKRKARKEKAREICEGKRTPGEQDGHKGAVVLGKRGKVKDAEETRGSKRKEG